MVLIPRWPAWFSQLQPSEGEGTVHTVHQHLRQWGFAYRQYADDNKDFLPRRGQGVKPLQQIDRPEDWFNALPPYLNQWSYQRLFTNNQRLQAGAHSPFICPAASILAATICHNGMNMNLCPWGARVLRKPQNLAA